MGGGAFFKPDLWRAVGLAVVLTASAAPAEADEVRPPVTAGSPEVPAAAKPGASPTTPPTLDKVAFVPTAIERNVNFVTELSRDCSSLGSIEYRVVVKPDHGTVTFKTDNSFPAYPMRSPMEHCDEQKAPGLVTRYQSDAGYVGEDHIDVLYLLPSSIAVEIKYLILVK